MSGDTYCKLVWNGDTGANVVPQILSEGDVQGLVGMATLQEALHCEGVVRVVDKDGAQRISVVPGSWVIKNIVHQSC